ncbi:protein kinase [Saccharomycopsis crataegensis]|uniref:non-specific serine/threonine protein kinase n=1 Tax=Saccharomycopsis crataegensis TaxID=43959 RepID=A0AAV5QP05_9ASCO|nr:protein kinase [Saccharomycopsis crataegensis]
MRKRNSFFFSSSTKKALKKRNKHKAKQKVRAVSGIPVSFADSSVDDNQNFETRSLNVEIGYDSDKDSESEGFNVDDSDDNYGDNGDYIEHGDPVQVSYRQLDFKQNVDLDRLRQTSVSPRQSVSMREARNADVNDALKGLSSPLIDTPETFDADFGRNEQEDLIRASSKNPTATLELDLDCNVKYLSKSWETFVGTSVRKIVNKPISKIIMGDDDDKDVFKRAIEIMNQDDASYRVRFIVAKNHITDYDDLESNKTGSSTSQEIEADLTLGESHLQLSPSSETSRTSSGSDLSTNDEFIELEGQGILIHDITTKEPTHSMWLLRPYIEHNFSIELPKGLAEILGFGADLFAAYLKYITDSGITDEISAPVPGQLFCNICERQVPCWWLERHSEICYAESKAESDLQIAHDNVMDHRNLINSIATSKVNDYKGLRIPIASDITTPNLITSRNLSTTLRFPFRTLHSLTELCDEAINIDPADFESDDEKPSKDTSKIEKEFNDIFEWHIPKSNDKAINTLIEDTEYICKTKAEAMLRVLNTQSYHEQLKNEVDGLVIRAVHDTVAKINEHLQGVNVNSANDTYSSPIIAAANTSSPDLIYNYMDKEVTPTVSSRATFEAFNSNINSRAPSVPSPLRNNSGCSMQRQPSSSSILSDRKSFYNMETDQLAESFKDISLLDSNKNGSTGSFKKPKDIINQPTPVPILPAQGSPRRPYSPGPIVSSPLTSIQRNNKSQNNLFLNSNDSSVFPKPNTANSSPLLLGGDGNNVNNVFLDYPRKDSEDGSHYSATPTNSLLAQQNANNKPPLSPLLISTFSGSKPAGPSIKDYEILKPISKGAFGSVYLARKKVNGEYFAIKVLKKSDMVAKNQVTNVKAERAIMMSQSNSPFVAKLFSTFQTRNYLFLVMEYLSGGDCASLLKVLGTLPEEWAKRYVAEIVVSVDDLHKKGIVHRDLKPDNFLIDSNGHLKLTDFGLSRMGLVGRQYRHQNAGNGNINGSAGISFDSEGNLPLSNPANSKKSTPIVPLLSEHKRSISYASSISSSDSGNNNSGSNFLFNNSHNSDAKSNSINHNSPTTAWFENLMKQEKSNSGLTGSPRSNSLAALNNNLLSNDVGGSPVLKPLHRSNSQTSFALLDDDISLNNQTPKNFALFNPSSSAETRRFVGTPDYLAPETIEGLGQNEASDWWSLGCILFEFLFGYPPFHANNINQVFENILSGKIEWSDLTEEEIQEICSPEARDLIVRLLNVDPRQRLGNNGAMEIKQHIFFKEIDWERLWDEEASFIPAVDNVENTDYFDSRGATMNADIYDKDDDALAMENDKQLSELFKPNNENYGTTPAGVENWLNDNEDDANIDNPAGCEILESGYNGNSSNSQNLGSPSLVKRERRKSARLNDSSGEFGSFQYRNLTALEKANKDIINRLKSEHLDHKNNISNSSSDSVNTKTRGFSFSSSLTNSPHSVKPPISAGANIASPAKSSFPGFVGHSNSFPSNHNAGSPILKLDKTNSAHSLSIQDEALLSTESSGRASPISTLQNSKHGSASSDTKENISCENTEFAVPMVYPKNMAKLSPAIFGQQPSGSPTLKPINRAAIYGKAFADVSPSSSDNEDSRNSAILRIKRRRSRRVGSQNSNNSVNISKMATTSLAHKHSISSTGEDLKFKSVDVLLCEPIPIFRYSARKILAKLGCNVVAVGSGDEIVRRISGQVKFDIILTTIKGEKLSLNDIIRLIRFTNTINSNTPIVALTSYYKEAVALKIFDDVIEKPATPAKLESVLSKFVSSKYDIASDAESIISVNRGPE